MKILLLGNCVVGRIGFFLQKYGNVQTVFCSNLYNWGNYHRDSFLRRAEEADLVVALSSRRAPLRHDRADLESAFGEKLVFLPLIWVDGLDTLQSFPSAGFVKFAGGEPIARHIRQHGAGHAYTALIKGELRSDPANRLTESLAEIRWNEAGGVQIADFIEENYRDRELMNSVGHPTGDVVLEVVRRLRSRIGLQVAKDIQSTPLAISRASLPRAPRVFSPYDVEDLGLNFFHDPDWMLQAKSILNVMGNSIRSGRLSIGLTERDV